MWIFLLGNEYVRLFPTGYIYEMERNDLLFNVRGSPNYIPLTGKILLNLEINFNFEIIRSKI